MTLVVLDLVESVPDLAIDLNLLASVTFGDKGVDRAVEGKVSCHTLKSYQMK